MATKAAKPLAKKAAKVKQTPCTVCRAFTVTPSRLGNGRFKAKAGTKAKTKAKASTPAKKRRATPARRATGQSSLF